MLQAFQKAEEYPFIAVVGNIGNGKTLVTTFIQDLFFKYCIENKLDFKNFSNYELFNIDNYKKIKVTDIVKFPSWLQNGILTLDEIHSEGGDSYNFLSRISKHLTTFLTQIRKRNLALIVTSQDWSFVNSRIRKLTKYVIYVVKLKGDLTKITIIDKTNWRVINELVLNLTEEYNNYNTREIILQKEIDKEEEELNNLAVIKND